MIFELTIMGLLAYTNPQPTLEASHRPQLRERAVIEHKKAPMLDPTKPPAGNPNAIFKIVHEGYPICGYWQWNLTGNPCWESTNIWW